MSGTLNLNNTERIICDRIYLISLDEVNNVYDLCLSRNDAADIVGLTPGTLNPLQDIDNSMGKYAGFLNTITTQINLKRNLSDSDGNIYIDNVISNYYTQPEIHTNIALTLDASVINS